MSLPFSLRVALAGVLGAALAAGAVYAVVSLPFAAGDRPPTLAERIDDLTVMSEQSRDRYSRDLFAHWVDADGDGCDTREEVLAAEAAEPVDGCDLTGAAWESRYDGFWTDDPSELDVDHLVPLAEAWDSGADMWDAERRREYANHLDHDDHLIAVSASSNRSKGDRDPSEWLPDRDVCWYLDAWVTVKTEWTLSIDRRERNALRGAAQDCT